MQIKKGSTRYVILTRKYAYKIPALYSWAHFLKGLLGNMQEKDFSKIKDWSHKLCPILFYVRGGFLVVMPRCQELQPTEMTLDELDGYAQINEAFKVPAENKYNSWGYYKGKLVAIDYGS